MRWWEILTIIVIALGVIMIIISLVKDKVKAKKCGSACASCPYSASCKKHKPKKLK